MIVYLINLDACSIKILSLWQKIYFFKFLYRVLTWYKKLKKKMFFHKSEKNSVKRGLGVRVI